MHFSLIIVTKDNLNFNSLNNIEHLILESSNSLNNYTYDYFITDSYNLIKDLDVLIEDDDVVCNYYLETSLENTFYIGKNNKSNKSKQDQFDLIIEYICENRS